MRRVGALAVVPLAALGLVWPPTAPGVLADPAELPTPGHLLVATDVRPGLLLAVETPDSTIDDPVTWTFDLATRTWTKVGAGPPGSVQPGFLVALPGRGAACFVPRWPGSVSAFDLSGRRWLQPAVPSVHPIGLSDVVVDEARERILAWSDADDHLWSYDATTNAWRDIPRRSPWPSAAMPGGGGGYTLMTYDTVADRIVLAVLPLPGRRGSTWLFDPSLWRWHRTDAQPPALMLGYGELGAEAAYDPVHRRTVLMARGVVTLYDSARDRWSVPSNAGWPGLFFGPDAGVEMDDGSQPWPQGLPLGALARDGHQLVVDEPHGRVVVVGGSALFPRPGATDPWDLLWLPVTSLWAYDVGFNTWTRIESGQR